MARPSDRISKPASRAGTRGMTLIELVVVIVLSAIVVSFMSMLIVTPIDAFNAQPAQTHQHALA